MAGDEKILDPRLNQRIDARPFYISIVNRLAFGQRLAQQQVAEGAAGTGPALRLHVEGEDGALAFADFERPVAQRPPIADQRLMDDLDPVVAAIGTARHPDQRRVDKGFEHGVDAGGGSNRSSSARLTRSRTNSNSSDGRTNCWKMIRVFSRAWALPKPS